MIFDVVVIGAGITGSAAGYYLVTNGTKNVLLLEQFDALHTRGSSHGGSRIGHNAYHETFYVNLMNFCYGMWRDIEKKSGEELYVETGLLSFGSAKAIRDYSTALKTNNVDHRTLTSKEINEWYSKQLKVPEEYLGIHVKQAGLIRATRSVATLQSLFVQFGGTLLDRHTVTGLVPGDVITVQTDKGAFRAYKVIVTAGAWTNQILESTGLKLPLKPIRTEALYWSAACPEAFTIKQFPVFLFVNENGYFDFYGLPIDEYHGLMRAAYHFGPEIVDPEARDTNPQAVTNQRVSQFLQKHFKGVHCNPAIVETCMYTATPDMHPIIDKHPTYPNIVIGTGFSGKGFKFGPVVGRILTELSEGSTPCVDVSQLSLKRFNVPNSAL